MFAPQEPRRPLGEPIDGLTRAELEERLALSLDLMAWMGGRKALGRAVLVGLEAGK